jgi:hypothetical protein
MSGSLRCVLSLVLAGSVLTGCTRFDPHRTTTITEPPKPVALETVECWSGLKEPKQQQCDEALPGTYAVQLRKYRYQDRRDEHAPIEKRTGQYHMAFVEFDDQGWFADRRQMEALFMLLGTLEDKHALILVYAHGWKHNADSCDNNVHCFSRLVERMDIMENQIGAGRHVVAVYVGWRGLSLEGVLANASFWTRKSTAERVGRGGVKELLTRLNEYRRARNRPPKGQATSGVESAIGKTQLVIAGHSFGGLVVYSALSHALIERASSVSRTAAGTACDGRATPGSTPVTCYETATSFGDLVVLVNPAFEASLYEPLFHVAVNRCYTDRQRPVMLTVTSSGDSATGAAFPFGRWINSLFEHAGSTVQGDSIVRTVGHDERYETHRLEWQAPPPMGATPEKTVATPDNQKCGCPYLGATEDFQWWEFLKSPKPLLGMEVKAETETGRRIYREYSRSAVLSGDMKYSANYPYLVIKADPKIIADHNSIYSEPFVEFLHKFFLVHVAAGRSFEADGCRRDFAGCLPGGPIPCERSCELPERSEQPGLPGLPVRACTDQR